MTKKVLFIALNFWAFALFAGDSTKVDTVNPFEQDTAFSVMSGVFTVGENKEVPQDGKITVENAASGEIVGIYKPNKNTGKYLFILPPGKTYKIKYEAGGNLFKSENLIVPVSTSYKKINQKINLGGL